MVSTITAIIAIASFAIFHSCAASFPTNDLHGNEHPSHSGAEAGKDAGNMDYEFADAAKHGPYSVERAIDGDTIVVNIGGESTKVRLIGIDAPESVHPDAEKNTPDGEEASEYVKALLDCCASVYLEYDIDRSDKYGRTLAYVWLTDGEMLNRILLREGYAVTMTVQPNSRYADEFHALQVAARESKVGLWGEPAR